MKTSWDSEDSNRLYFLRQERKLKFTEISKTLKRTPNACRVQFNRIANKGEDQSSWTDVEISRFSTAVDQIKASSEDAINFKLISCFVKTKSEGECKKRWACLDNKRARNHLSTVERQDAKRLPIERWLEKYPDRHRSTYYKYHKKSKKTHVVQSSDSSNDDSDASGD